MHRPSFRSSPGFITFSVSCAAFTETFLYGLIIPLLPFSLVSRSNVHPRDVQKWISGLLAMYGVGSLVGSFLAAVAASYVRPQTTYLAGLIALAASTIAFALGRDVWVLLVGRACQGLAAASVWTVGLMILTRSVGQEDSGKALGYVNAAAALGYMCGPPVAGLLYDHVGYYAVFGAAFFLLLLDIVVRLAMVVPEHDDVAGGSGAGGLGRTQKPAGQGAADSEPSAAPDPDEQTALLQKTSAKAGGFSPLMPLLRCPRMLAALLVSANEHIILTGIEAVLPVYVKGLFGWTSSTISLLFFVLVAPVLLSPLVGWMSDRLGARLVVTTGLAVAAVGVTCLIFVSADTPGHIAALVVLVGVIGSGVALLLTPVIGEVARVVESVSAGKDRKFADQGSALAFGMINAVMMVAGIIGPAVCGALVEGAGWGAMSLALGGFCAVSALIVSLSL